MSALGPCTSFHVRALCTSRSSMSLVPCSAVVMSMSENSITRPSRIASTYVVLRPVDLAASRACLLVGGRQPFGAQPDHAVHRQCPVQGFRTTPETRDSERPSSRDQRPQVLPRNVVRSRSSGCQDREQEEPAAIPRASPGTSCTQHWSSHSHANSSGFCISKGRSVKNQNRVWDLLASWTLADLPMCRSGSSCVPNLVYSYTCISQRVKPPRVFCIAGLCRTFSCDAGVHGPS